MGTGAPAEGNWVPAPGVVLVPGIEGAIGDCGRADDGLVGGAVGADGGEDGGLESCEGAALLPPAAPPDMQGS